MIMLDNPVGQSLLALPRLVWRGRRCLARRSEAQKPPRVPHQRLLGQAGGSHPTT